MRSGRLVDGRLAGPLRRRIVEVLGQSPYMVVPLEALGDALWPNGRPSTWRHHLIRTVRDINLAYGRNLIERVRQNRLTVGMRINGGLVTPSLTMPTVPRLRHADSGLLLGEQWTEREDALLRQLAGKLPSTEIAKIVSERYAVSHRTRRAVEQRMNKLRLSYVLNVWSATQVARLFGFRHDTIARRWIRTGLLKTSYQLPDPAVHPDARPKLYWIRDEQIEAFIREMPWHYDHRLMTSGHRFTRLAELVYRTDPYLYLDEAAKALNVCTASIWTYLRRGLLPNARRMATNRGGARGLWRIPASDLQRLGASKIGDRRSRINAKPRTKSKSEAA